MNSHRVSGQKSKERLKTDRKLAESMGVSEEYVRKHINDRILDAIEAAKAERSRLRRLLKFIFKH